MERLLSVLFFLFRVNLRFNSPRFVEDGQTFTCRAGEHTVATGRIVKVLPPLTEAEKDKRTIKKMMKAEMEKLGWFNSS